MSDNILALYTNVYTQCGRSLDNEIGHQSSRFRVAGKTRTVELTAHSAVAKPWEIGHWETFTQYSDSAVQIVYTLLAISGEPELIADPASTSS